MSFNTSISFSLSFSRIQVASGLYQSVDVRERNWEKSRIQVAIFICKSCLGGIIQWDRNSWRRWRHNFFYFFRYSNVCLFLSKRLRKQIYLCTHTHFLKRSGSGLGTTQSHIHRTTIRTEELVEATCSSLHCIRFLHLYQHLTESP